METAHQRDRSIESRGWTDFSALLNVGRCLRVGGSCLDGDDVGLVDAAVDRHGGARVVTEDRAPAAERLIGHVADTALLVAVRMSWTKWFATSRSGSNGK